MKELVRAAVLIAVLIYGMNKFQKWEESRRDPCVEANWLHSAAEQTRLQMRIDAIESKKEKLDDKLDDAVDRLQMSPEQYARYQEALRNDEELKKLDEFERTLTVSQRKDLEDLTKRAADMDAACKQKSSLH